VSSVYLLRELNKHCDQSIEAVPLWKFAIATIFCFPKIFLEVFIGSRIAALSDGGQRQHMDTQTKLINWALLIGGILVAIIASIVVYRLVQKQIRQRSDLSPDVEDLAAEAIEDIDEGAPLLRDFSPSRTH